MTDAKPARLLLKVTLRNIEPPIWRRIAVAEDVTIELVAGERACPPEDCGGPYGYAGLVETLRNRKHPEHAEMREWIGNFDPDVFDIDAARRRVAKVIKPRARTPR